MASRGYDTHDNQTVSMGFRRTDHPTSDAPSQRPASYVYAIYHSHDHDYYPPTALLTASARIERHQRAPWPPFPTVEDLETALAKEAGPCLDDGKRGDEVPNRGSVDQEPIMVEVEGDMAYLNPESRRFILMPGADDVATKPTALTAPPLRSDHLRHSPDVSPSGHVETITYNGAYFPPDLGALPTLSSGPPRARPTGRGGAASVRPQPAPLPTKPLFSVDLRREHCTSNSSNISADEPPSRLRARPKLARYSSSPADWRSNPDLRTSVHAVTSSSSSSPRAPKGKYMPPTSPVTPRRDYVPSPSPNNLINDTSNDTKHPWLGHTSVKPPVSSPSSCKLRYLNISTQRNGTTRGEPPILMNLTPLSAGRTPSSPQFFGTLPRDRLTPSQHTTSETPYVSGANTRQNWQLCGILARAWSPNQHENMPSPSPPQSPPLTPRSVNEEVSGGHGSRSATSNSRASPLLLGVDRNSLTPSPRIEIHAKCPDRVSAFSQSGIYKPWHGHHEPAVAATSRPYMQDAPLRIDVQCPSPVRHPPSTTIASLPYPVDTSPALMMPEEHTYQSKPSSPRSPKLTIPDYPHDSAMLPMPSHVRKQVTAPRVPLRRALSETSVQRGCVNERALSLSVRSNKEVSSNILPEMPDLPLPPCPRSSHSTIFTDWYSLASAPSFDICPACLEHIIGRCIHRSHFVKSSLSDAPKRCHFSSAWYRLAWLMTVRQRRGDLGLIFSLAAITNSKEPCPGDYESAQAWYGLPSGRGFISSFHICERDLLYLEALMPTLRGHLRRIDSPSPYPCAFRTESKRFPRYLDLLLEIDEEALSSRRRAPDLSRFIRFARDHAWKPECPGDMIVFDVLWHWHPALPEFTVCDECYEEVVYPDVKRGSALADEVTPTPGFAPNKAGLVSAGGSCCQLYSPHMRRIWARAVRDDNFSYLARKIRERRLKHHSPTNIFMPEAFQTTG